MRKKIFFITHADVLINKDIPVPDWGLSAKGKERHEIFNKNSQIQTIRYIYCSNERKAKEGAIILSKHLKINYTLVHDLHENDRSSTGFLPPEEFQLVADEFFKLPHESVRGWERAIDAQNRIVNCVASIIHEQQNQDGDIAIVAHGGVGTLLLCKLLKIAISRAYDQPLNNGGNYFTFYADDFSLISLWTPIDASEHLVISSQ